MIKLSLKRRIDSDKYLSKGHYYAYKKANTDSNKGVKQYCQCFESQDDDCTLGLLMSNDAWSKRRRKRDPPQLTSSNQLDTQFTIQFISDFAKNQTTNIINHKYTNKSSCDELLNVNQDSLRECNNRGLVNLSNIVNNCKLDFNVIYLCFV